MSNDNNIFNLWVNFGVTRSDIYNLQSYNFELNIHVNV